MAKRHLETVRDRAGRALRELRVSVTDRCNFRCPYCMPREAFGGEHRFLPRKSILSFEEITRVVSVFQGLGVRKVRLTGGEPLLRTELPSLVRRLGSVPELELALTTNGSLLERLAEELADAGLSRITVSLDSLDDTVFRAMSDTELPVDTVLRGIDAAVRAGLTPVKVNTVVRRGVNDADVLDLAGHFHGTGITVRFIEYMDVGTTNGWRRSDVVTAREIVDRIDAVLPLEPLDTIPSGVARRYRYRDGGGEIGVIASVTEPFCGTCTRARISADGHLYTCLFATRGTDLRPILRSGAPDSALEELITNIWATRSDRYSEKRFAGSAGEKIEMSYIGG